MEWRLDTNESGEGEGVKEIKSGNEEIKTEGNVEIDPEAEVEETKENEERQEAAAETEAKENPTIEEKKEGVFTEWLEISPLFQSMGIEFENYEEFIELYNSTAKK